MPSTPEAALKDIKAGKLAPVYLLAGEEVFFIDKVEEAILSAALAPGEADFNLDILYSKDVQHLKDVASICMNYPVFANRRVVLLREAQHYRADDWKQLESYVQSPMETTVLVISHKHKNLDKRTAFSKLVERHGVLVESPKLKEYQLPGWIKQYIESRSFRLTEGVAELLADNLGNDLSRIANEVEKLELALEKGATVSKEVVEKYIGISRDYNNLELSNAVQEGNIAKAIKIIDYFNKNPKAGPTVVLIATIYSFFIRLWQLHHALLEGKSQDAAMASAGINPYFAASYKKAMNLYPLDKTERAIHLLALYDARSKGIDNHGTGDAQLMTELIFQIMH